MGELHAVHDLSSDPLPPCKSQGVPVFIYDVSAREPHAGVHYPASLAELMNYRLSEEALSQKVRWKEPDKALLLKITHILA